MKKHVNAVATLLFLIALSHTRISFAEASSSAGLNLYVASSGNDQNAGTELKPFATLAGARSAIQGLKRRGLPAGGVTVWVHGGRYLLDHSFELTKEDSGEPGRPIAYRAVTGEQPRIVGGTSLDLAAFQTVADARTLATLAPAARGHVRALHLPATAAGPAVYPAIFKGSGGMVQLLFQDRVMPLSRWPNAGYTTMASVEDSGITPPHGGTFHYREEAEDHATRWAQAAAEGRLWLTGFWRVPFEVESVQVKRVDTATRAITLNAPVPQGIGSKYVDTVDGTRHGNGKEQYYAFNLPEEIDRPGEWSYDFRTRTIYFWPPADQGEVLLANLNGPVISINGASDVRLEGLTIEGGLAEGVKIADGVHDVVAGCVVRNTAGGGIDVEGGSDDLITSNDLLELGSYGIRLVAGDRPKLVPGRLVAANNHIYRFGQQERITEGIYLGGVGNKAVHNLIHDGPYNGINYQGNDQYMAYNEIHHIGLDAGDLGPFYTNGDWAAQGNVIEYNFAHHSPNANGSYIDDGGSGRTTRYNVFYKLSAGIFMGGGHNNVIVGNLIVECKTGIHVDNRGVARHYDSTAHHLTQALKTIDPNRPPWSTKYPGFLTGILADPTQPTGNTFDGNVLVNVDHPYDVAAPATVDAAKNPVVNGDAGFVDPARLDLTPKPAGAVYRALPSFHPIPMHEIGLQVDEYRRTLPTDEETGRMTDRARSMEFDSTTDVKASDKLGIRKP